MNKQNTQNQIGGGFGVGYHTHNGIDSPLLPIPKSGSVVYGGQVDGSGGGVLLPTGWTSARPFVGVYTVTHNLNTTKYSVVASSYNNGTRYVDVENMTSTSFQVFMFNSASSNQNSAFNFILTIVT